MRGGNRTLSRRHLFRSAATAAASAVLASCQRKMAVKVAERTVSAAEGVGKEAPTVITGTPVQSSTQREGGIMDSRTGTVFYVATDGNDAWSGTLPKPNAAKTDGPFATLSRAIDAARALGTEVPRRIIVRGGKYYDVAAKLNARDSGLTIEGADGEEPILYGGHPITGWERDADDLWAAKLPGVAEGTWDFRMLVVNGRFCPRARLPREGAFTHLSEFPVRWMTSTGGGWERKPTKEELTTLKYKEGDLGPWLDVRNAEVTVYHAWDDSMVGIKAIDPAARTLTFSSPAGHPPGAFGSWIDRARTYVVWNTREGMHEPGQWYLDRRAGKVVYWPKDGEEMSQAEVIAPTTETIIGIRGRAGAPVKDLTLKGLALSVTNTPLIAADFGAESLNGAITGMGPLVNCRFSDLKMENVAGHGIKIRDKIMERMDPAVTKARHSANSGIRIEGCETAWTGAGGIYLTAQDSVMTENLIQHVGVMYPAAIGLRFTGDRIEVSHNEIRDTSYSGFAGHFGKGARVEYNEFSEVMRVLYDGAAIYVFYVEDLVMRGNVAYDIGGGGHPRHAYYLDEMSENCDVAENLAVNCPSPSMNHMGSNNRIWGNVFIVNGDAQLNFPRSRDFALERNIIWATGGITFRGINAVTKFAKNVFYSGTARVVGIELDKDARVVSGEVALESSDDTLLVDPLFVDLEHGDYRLKQGSPAIRLGIKPIDVSQAGRSKH